MILINIVALLACVPFVCNRQVIADCFPVGQGDDEEEEEEGEPQRESSARWYHFFFVYFAIHWQLALAVSLPCLPCLVHKRARPPFNNIYEALFTVTCVNFVWLNLVIVPLELFSGGHEWLEDLGAFERAAELI